MVKSPDMTTKKCSLTVEKREQREVQNSLNIRCYMEVIQSNLTKTSAVINSHRRAGKDELEEECSLAENSKSHMQYSSRQAYDEVSVSRVYVPVSVCRSASRVRQCVCVVQTLKISSFSQEQQSRGIWRITVRLHRGKSFQELNN